MIENVLTKGLKVTFSQTKLHEIEEDVDVAHMDDTIMMVQTIDIREMCISRTNILDLSTTKYAPHDELFIFTQS